MFCGCLHGCLHAVSRWSKKRGSESKELKRTDHLEAFDRLVNETLTEIALHEPGALVYLNHQWVDHPDERVFYECRQSKEAFEAHETEMHTKRFLDERGQHLAQPAEVWWLDTLDGVIRRVPRAR